MNDPGGETYPARRSLARAQEFAAGVLAAAGASRGDDDPAQPFVIFRWTQPTEAGQLTLFETRCVKNVAEGWRRADTDWLQTAIQIAEAWTLEKKGWEMPHRDIAARLKEKTRGRVLRADTGVPEAKETDAPARKEFLERTR